MKSIFSNNGYEANRSQFKRTNYILKETAAKIWPTYSITGTTEFKPYPVFDANGTPCPPRMVSPYEANGNIPDAETLSADQIREYEESILPPAFISVPTVTWVGKDGVQFIDYCTDIMNYQTDEEKDSGRLPRTPYTAMARTLNKLIPTDRNPGDGKPCPPSLMASRNARKGQVGLKLPNQTILVRGALLKFRGQPMTTKSSVNGVLYRVCLLISQKSARVALRSKFSEKTNPAEPISATNFPLQGMFHPQGTYLAFSKSEPSNPQSAILIKPGYSDEFNNGLLNFFSASDMATYFAKVREDLGAFQNMEDMLELMTVKQQLDLIFDQFPAAWVWYGLRDSSYAELVPQAIREQALQDPEWSDRFGITKVADGIPYGTAPAAPVYVPPMTPRVEAPPQGYGVPTVPPVAQQAMKSAEVSYTPQPTAGNPVVDKILNKYQG